ncbi:MAG TPA: HAD hydrolase-like protein [Gemmatimonadales bacterium]|nr:HAD hydrolase-like protein [Gemmatimonadales bacterium]
MRVILFDIDGTLLWSDGAGRRAMEGALVETFGTAGDSAYRYDGKTDPQIARELMVGEGFSEEHVDSHLTQLLDSYLARLREAVSEEASRPHLFAGVPELMDALEARSDVLMGLLTGNIHDGARVKLSAAGLNPDRFAFGAFGSDHHHRPELPAIARQRASSIAQREIRASRMLIIGDTPADVYCGQGIGARAMAVATGRYSRAELAACAPASVFEDLSDTEAVLAAIDRVTSDDPDTVASHA